MLRAAERERAAASAGRGGPSTGPSKWLGLGALLLTGLLLQQLLLNVWLLGAWLLVALLGGWLGAQLVLGAGSPVHLERFIRLEARGGGAAAAAAGSEGAASSLLSAEIQATLGKIVRDFVSSWYRRAVSREPGFEREAIVGMAAKRGKGVRGGGGGGGGGGEQQQQPPPPPPSSSSSSSSSSQEQPPQQQHRRLLQPERRRQQQQPPPSSSSSSSSSSSQEPPPPPPQHHRRLLPQPERQQQQPQPQRQQQQQQQPPPPPPHRQQDHRPQQQHPQKHQQQQQQRQPPQQPPPPPARPEVPASLPLIPEGGYAVRERTPTPKPADLPSCSPGGGPNAGGHGEPVGDGAGDYRQRPDKLTLFYSCEEYDPDDSPPFSDARKDSADSTAPPTAEETLAERLAPTGLSQPLETADDGGGDELTTAGQLTVSDTDAASAPSFDQNPESVGFENASDEDGKDEIFSKLAASSTVLAHETIRILSRQQSFQEKECVPSDSPTSNSLDVHSAELAHTSSPTGLNLPTYAFDPLCSPDTPVVIQNLRICGTITAKEHRGGGSHPYTLYTIKYETALDTDHPGTLQQVAYHTVNRRYSEFLNLQTRLEEKTELRKLIKNVKGPKKLFPDLPFGNMDSDKVEARKSLLESFLKQLCAIPESANCEEMQEFLALNTDARIAFVKKSIVSRIDKIVVSVIVDTLKTAFPRAEPQSPTEEVGECEVDGKSQSDGKKTTKSRLRFSSSKIAPVLSVADIQAKVTYCFNENRLPSEGLCLAGMEDFILEQERLLERMQTSAGVKGTKEEINVEGEVSAKRPQIVPSPSFDRNLNSDSEMALADVALDVLCLLMKDHWSWLCTENMQKVIRLLCGTLLERWLEVQIANLTCTQHWVVYLRLLQEAIWPGGTLPKWPKPVRSQEQKQQTQEQAYQSLMKLLPALVPEVLGEEGYRKSWRHILDSLQNPLINRHLVYCICDLLLEFLIPEASSEEFQRSLLSCVSGSVERVPN
eukprot:gi/632957183/ref/XP_007894334.1/ PREDICTED: LOW QUALITY PROTEIN: sorting nexin-19 [Callorhinchus milii]